MKEKLKEIYYEYRWRITYYFHPRSIRYMYQFLTRGFSDKQIWNLDNSLSKFLQPRLREFRKNLSGHPSDLKGMKEWETILDKIDLAIVYHQSDGDDLDSGIDIDDVTFEYGGMKTKKDEKKWNAWIKEMARRDKVMDDGFALLGKYYRNLWD